MATYLTQPRHFLERKKCIYRHAAIFNLRRIMRTGGDARRTRGRSHCKNQLNIILGMRMGSFYWARARHRQPQVIICRHWFDIGIRQFACAGGDIIYYKLNTVAYTFPECYLSRICPRGLVYGKFASFYHAHPPSTTVSH